MINNRILYIANDNIHSKSGGGYANLAFYKSLLSTYKDRVDIVQYKEYDKNNSDEDYLVPQKSLLRKFRDFPTGVIHRFSPWIYDFVKKHGYKYQCCIINSGFLGDCILYIKKYIRNIIVIHHNCEVEFQSDNNRPTTLWGIFPYFMARNEKLAYLNADLNLFLTEYDKTLFIKRYGKINEERAAVIGIYFPYDQIKPLIHNLNTNVLAITGSLHNIQTIKGIRNFYNNYFKSYIKHTSTPVEVIISGRNPGRYITSISQDNEFIKLYPNPQNMDDVLSMAGIFVCPINVGSGIKLRVMDGLSLGMPILAHEVSARGYEMFNDKPWFRVYNDYDSFEEGLNGIQKYCSQNNNIRQEIQSAYYSFFSFYAGTNRLISLIDKFCK